MSDSGGELESLQRENARLRRLLKLTEAEASPARGTQAASFDKNPGPVEARSSPRAKVEFYAAPFGARRDVYDVRWENVRYGKSGWMPAVEGGWRKRSKVTDHRYLPLTPEVLASHRTGDIHIEGGVRIALDCGPCGSQRDGCLAMSRPPLAASPVSFCKSPAPMRVSISAWPCCQRALRRPPVHWCRAQR